MQIKILSVLVNGIKSLFHLPGETDRIAASGEGNPSACCGGFCFAFFEPRWCSYQCAGGLSISDFLAEDRGDLGGFVTRGTRLERLRGRLRCWLFPWFLVKRIQHYQSLLKPTCSQNECFMVIRLRSTPFILLNHLALLILDIKMHILFTVLQTFLMELLRIVCLKIKTSYPSFSLPLFSSLECLNKY